MLRKPRRVCDVDADCDDGLFCNGEETCVDGECQAGTNPCSAEQECDEEYDECLNPAECEVDADCDDGLFCNGEETCLDGECFAGENPCLEDEICNEDEDACEEATVPEELTITYSPETPSPNQSITFSAAGGAAEEDNIFHYWSFDDGVYNYAPSFSRSFDEPGEYIVALTIYNASTWQILETVEETITVLPRLSVLSALAGNIGPVEGLALSEDGNIAWVAGGKYSTGEGTIAKIDITNPGSPVQLGSSTFMGYPWQIDTAGDLIAVAASHSGLLIFDINDIGSGEESSILQPAGRFDTLNFDNTYARGVAFIGNDYVSVASDLNLKIFSVTELLNASGDPNSIEPIATIHESVAGKMTVHDGYLYAGKPRDHRCWLSMFPILRISATTRLSIKSQRRAKSMT